MSKCGPPRFPAIIDDVESFIGRMRDELLDGEVRDRLDEARGLVEARRKAYNLIKPLGSS